MSTILHDGPLKTTIHSETNDGKWEATWEIYPNFATMTVLKTDHDYWFLYEGTPGGSLDTGSDTVVRADGTTTLAQSSWTGDLPGDEWVYFADPLLGRSLFAANHQDDTAVDSYRPMNGEMTVFGFGRSGLNTLMGSVPAKFTIGLFDETAHGQASPIINSAYRDLVLTVGSAEQLVPEAPVAADDNYVTDLDTPLSVDAMFGVLANDSDLNGDVLESFLVDDVLNGSLTLNVDGSFDYIPDPGFIGSDSFTYRASDSLLVSDLATVTILVRTPPTAADDTYEIDEDTPLVVAAAGVLSNDVDNELPADLLARLISGPSNGTLTAFSSDGSFTYVPDADFNGVDSFIYAAEDGVTGSTDEATVTLTVNGVNDAPVGANDSYATSPDTPLSVDAASGVLANDFDVDFDALEAILVDDVTGGTLTLNPDGSFEYTPDPGFVGSDSFTYRANDSSLESSLATVYLNVVSSDPDLLVALPLDEGSGSLAGDVSGNGNDGILVGGASLKPAREMAVPLPCDSTVSMIRLTLGSWTLTVPV